MALRRSRVVNELRILHVLPHLSPDRRYGGPLTVALTQARALIDRGHEVVVLGGADRGLPRRALVDGVECRLFRSFAPRRSAFGFRTAPGLKSWYLRHAGSFDVSHIHLARDFTTLPVAAASGAIPTVLQPHGMLSPSTTAPRRLLDSIWTRPAFRNASAVIALTARERELLRADFADFRAHLLPNAVERRTVNRRPEDGVTRVLYLARLHTRKRPRLFLQAATLLSKRGGHWSFDVVGPDEGELRFLKHLANQSPDLDIRFHGPATASETVDYFASADIYVLPSVDEPFGLTMLESLAVGTPVVAASDAPLGVELNSLGLADLFDGTPENLADVIDNLASDTNRRAEIARMSAKRIDEFWGTETMAGRLEEIYEEVLSR
ncbi:glycosyltransferase [Microbacterium ureisolvens]|uniref:glycosyltransferase n=1 Tax=Microbacterium ureisolvens TaxID=2781186 RepID=UPI003624C4DC